ncbi:MAG: hypothetical protein SPI65_05155 [Peptoniphilus sp.]|nr:hypothetical protein [Peptoniphilus sp.]MDD7362653.1 hypothetical protein [Bacillota bacterium]MDY6044948.1 hypothetical protein [Peptoniphilus sp.]
MKNLEAAKNKYLGTRFLFTIMAIIHIAGVFINTTAKDSTYPLYAVLDTYFFLQTIFDAVLIAAIVKKVVEIEERHDMWQLQQSLGLDVSAILSAKLKHLAANFLLVQLFEWILLIAIASRSPNFMFYDDTLLRIALSFVSVYIIHLTMAALFLWIEVRVKKIYFTLFFSIIGTLTGIVCMLTSRILSFINPFAWTTTLMNISYVRDRDTFVQVLNPLNPVPLFLGAIVLSILILSLKHTHRVVLEREA